MRAYILVFWSSATITTKATNRNNQEQYVTHFLFIDVHGRRLHHAGSWSRSACLKMSYCIFCCKKKKGEYYSPISFAKFDDNVFSTFSWYFSSCHIPLRILKKSPKKSRDASTIAITPAFFNFMRLYLRLLIKRRCYCFGNCGNRRDLLDFV